MHAVVRRDRGRKSRLRLRCWRLLGAAGMALCDTPAVLLLHPYISQHKLSATIRGRAPYGRLLRIKHQDDGHIAVHAHLYVVYAVRVNLVKLQVLQPALPWHYPQGATLHAAG
ncbi:MAG TPA: hypothetical protein VNN76_07265 [Bacteroidota bacterium]|nr:hypothetical protein [Bacteroidota bacterium]